jgi:hypothetical protein
MGQSHFEICQQREVGSGAGDFLEVEDRRDDRILKDRSLDQQITPGARQDRSPGERLAALKSHQLCQCDINPVLPGDVLCQTSPASQTDGPTGGVIATYHPPSRTGTRNEDDLSSIESRQHRGERVPSVLTDKDRCPPPTSIERLHAAAGLDEALLVEDPVGGKKDLAVNVPNPGVWPAERSVEARVIKSIPMDFVEAERNIDRRRAGFFVLAAEVIEQPIGRNREISNTTLQEVAGQRRFRCDDQLRWLRPCPHLAKQSAQPAEVLLVSPLVGADLGDSEAEHALKVRGEM